MKERGTSSGGASDVSESTNQAKKSSRKPKYSRFSQQELPACKPILTPGWVITSFILIGAVFIPIGLASLFASERVVEIVDRYDHDCIPPNNSDSLGYIQNSSTNKTCIKSFVVPKKMKSPIYVYYQLSNFYQNHRRYVKSRNDKQLRSSSAATDVDKCEPEDYNDKKQPIVPCGLIAWSLFNDTYKFTVNNNKELEVNKVNIAWDSDKGHKFGSDVYPKNFQSGGLIGGGKLDPNKPLSEQEELIVWMRTAALPTFRKLYGRIEEDLAPNDKITVIIQNNYNTYSYGGKKRLVLSTTSWMGGKNDFLGVAYLAVGGLCLFLALCFILIYVLKPRPLGDPSYLSWNRNAAGHAN